MTTMTRRTGTVRKVAHDPGDPLVTSHCPFCGSGQVVGRSDGTIGCDFCGSNYIVRVQPAFPGMPQMPMGPGAPSDVGPDGGLVDPGMIGPDGAPVDEGGGPLPGEDAEPEGGPQDESPGGDGDMPPSGGDSSDDASSSGPPGKGGPPKSKGKSKKESSRRRYLGLEGQVLTEDQLVRHVAVRVSGADPRVMRVLRATAARGRRPFAVTASAVDGPGWWDELIPGDRITGRVQGERLRGMREHFRGLGFPVQDTDSHGYENLGPNFDIPDTGHHVSIGHSRADETWVASIHHPGDHLMSGQKTIASVNLGTNAEHVPHLLMREMGSRPVTDEMRRQWGRANSGADYGDRPPGGWRKPDGKRPRPKVVRFTARGATPPGQDDDGWI